MAVAKVKCKYCGQYFNRNAEPFVEVGGRRYAHAACAETLSQEERDYLELEKYIKQLFGINTLTARIKRQIADYKEQYNYSYSGMQKTLYWWFELKKNSLDKANNGIGIVPYVYQDACDYYYRLYLAQIANDISDIQKIHNVAVKEIEIGSPRVRTDPPKLFNFEDE